MAGVPQELLGDRQFILAAMERTNSVAFAQATPELQADWELGLRAIRDSAYYFHVVAATLQQDPTFIREAIRLRPEMIADISSDFWADQDILLAAIASDEQAISFAAPSLRNNRQFWLAATAANGYVLQAARAFSADREIVLTAVQSVRHSRPDFRLGGPERLVTDFGSFARGTPLRWAAAELQCDRELLLAAAAFSYDALEFCCEHLQSDAEFVLAAIAAHPRGGWALQYVAVALRSDARVVEAAVLSCPDAFQFAAEDLRVDRNLIRLVCEGFAKYESEDDQNVVREYIHEAYRSQVERWAASESAVARRDSLRLTFPELHARFISCPVEGDDERLADMPDLGWYVRSSLATEDS
uniref:DUF4116 domain-containing protein n=1 Tax=Pinguiococcus pyrenoidosus TaxID=172671 RepID=A0A7R9UFW0_9STRA